jgi:hypothetical protein
LACDFVVAAKTWRYEPDENPKRRHAWSNAHAGFVIVQGVEIGKCPNNISLAEAERLLNTGIPLNATRSVAGYPARVYVVHDGVVYRATPTNPGVSYHAFPEKAEEFRRLPRSVREAILSEANRQGYGEDVGRWSRS